MWIHSHYPELAFFFARLGLLKWMQNGCVCEVRYFDFARDLVSDSFSVDVYGSSRRLCSRVVRAFVGYAHYGESPSPCLAPLTVSACGCSCVCDLVRVRYLASLVASGVSVGSECVPSLAQALLR